MTLDVTKLDPAASFDTPDDVLRADLSKADKEAILQRWEADIQARMQAGDEGMPQTEGTSADHMAAVRRALAALVDLSA